MQPINKIIDVSKWQGTIDFKKVKADGYAGVIIRAGYSWYSGGMTIDEKFHENVKNAIAAKLPVGIYIYAYDKTTIAAKTSAQKLYDLIAPYKIELGVYYDIEDKTHAVFTKTTNTNIAKTFCDFFKQKNYYAGVYTYVSFANSYLNPTALSDYDFWVAHYADKCGYTGDYGMWQYTSKGKVDGIDGNVDINNAYIDYVKIIKDGGYNNLTIEETKPQGIYMTEITEKVLFVTADNCECFDSPNVNDIAGLLGNGLRYNCIAKTTEKYNGYNWAVIEYNEQEYFVVVLTDRCKIIDKSETVTPQIQKALWPTKVMRLTQDEYSTYSHAGSTAIDSGDKDGNIQKIYAPCDMTFTRVRKNESSQEIYAESVAPVLWANGDVDYMSFTFMHDDYINSNVVEGATVQQGEYFADEGGHGYGRPGVFANHCHMQVSRGKSTSSQYKNAYGTWVTANGVSAYNALFVPEDVEILNDYGHNWVRTKDSFGTLPSTTPTTPTEFKKYNVKPTTDLLNIRSGPGTEYNVLRKAASKYEYTILEHSQNGEWGKTSIGWLCLEYTKKV